MPFSVNFTVDADKTSPNGVQAGDLRVSYGSPSDAAQPLGHWSYHGRCEANAEEALADVCASFEAWRARREVEIGIEASIKSALAPLCPCHEEPSEDQEPEPEDEPTPEE